MTPVPTLMPPPTPSPPLAPAASCPADGLVVNEGGVADGHGRAKCEVDTAAHAGGADPAAAAGPASSDVVSERTAGPRLAEETAIDGDTAPFPDTAGAAGRPGAADSLIAGERTVGNDHGGVGQCG